jgi:hypothetical protein
MANPAKAGDAKPQGLRSAHRCGGSDDDSRLPGTHRSVRRICCLGICQQQIRLFSWYPHTILERVVYYTGRVWLREGVFPWRQPHRLMPTAARLRL